MRNVFVVLKIVKNFSIMPYLRFLVLLSFVFVATSCTNDSTNDLISDVPVEETITYSEHIAPVIAANCTNCHGSTPTFGAPMSLVTLDQVRQSILNQDLIGRMQLPNGDDLLMPQGGPRLPDATIQLFVRWQEDGFQN